MKNIWKRSLSLFLAMAMVFSMLPVSALANELESEETMPAEVIVETTEAPAETEDVTEAPAEETEAPAEEPAEQTEETEAPAEVIESTAAEEVEETTEAAEENETPEIITETMVAVPDVEGLPSDEELFAAYAESVLYGTEIATFGTAAGDRLTGDAKLAYDALVPVIKAIASGEHSNTSIALGSSIYGIPVDVEMEFDGDFLSDPYFMIDILNALLADLPYEMYWFDKVSGLMMSRTQGQNDAGETVYLLDFYFQVTGNYSDGSTEVVYMYDSETGESVPTYFYCGTDTAKTGAAAGAAASAKSVVASVAQSAGSDYKKLVAYKDWILDAVSYDQAAADANDFSGNADPWQLIYVFDGDSSTNVVCEGYSKAFQYLCDLTEWDGDITCYCVSGNLTGEGEHMWNIVTIDGVSYLADLTNCDEDTLGADGSLFLAGTAGSNGYYTFNTMNDTTASYEYDYDTQDMWGDTGILELSETNYEAPEEDGGDIDIGDIPTADEQYPQLPMFSLQQSINDAAAAGDTEYWLRGNYSLAGELTLPENFGFYAGSGATIVVPEGQTLTLPGIELFNATLLVRGTLNITDAMFINHGSYVLVEDTGVLNQTGAIHVGFHIDRNQFEGDYAGVLDICGTMNVVGGYLNVAPYTNSSFGAVNVYDTLNIHPNDNGWGGFLQLDGEVLVGSAGKLNVTVDNLFNGGIMVGPSGMLITELTAELNVQHLCVSMIANGNAVVQGLDESEMYGIYRVDTLEDLAIALIADQGYGAVQIELNDASLDLTRDLIIPEGTTLVINYSGNGEEVVVNIPEGVTLTNNGELVINNSCSLKVLSGAELVNNGSIYVSEYGALYNYSTITGTNGKDGIACDGTYIDEGTVTGHEELQNNLNNMPDWAGGWVVETPVTLDPNVNGGVLDVSLGIRESDGWVRQFWLEEGGVIRVPDGCTLNINSPVNIVGGKIIVEAGGTLNINAYTKVADGLLYMFDGAILNQFAGVNGKISGEGDHNPWLGVRYLYYDNGLFVDPDSALNIAYGMDSNGCNQWVMFLNLWNEEEFGWDSFPVIPYAGENSRYTVNMMADMGNFDFRDDSAYLDYIIQMDSFGGLDGYDDVIRVDHDGETYDFNFMLWPVEVGFFKDSTPSEEGYLGTGGEFRMDPNAEENAAYLIIRNTDMPVDSVDFACFNESDQLDYADILPEGEEPVTMEKISDTVYKFTIHPAIASMSRAAWTSVRTEVYLNLDYGERWQYNLRFTSPENMTGDGDANFDINGRRYMVYDLGDGEQLTASWIPNGQISPEGYEINDWVIVDLPEGVSYDLDTNTMTLENADLETLRLQNHWAWDEEIDGETIHHEGYDLPNGDFTINLIGESIIANDHSTALSFGGDMNLTITGDGGLWVYANNGEGHSDEWGNYSYDAIFMYDNANLTIAGNAEVNAHADGIAYWDGENGTEQATIAAIWGDGESTLIVKDNATLLTTLPENARFTGFTANEYGEYPGGYRGLFGFTTIDVQDNAFLHTQNIQLHQEGASLNVSGGLADIHGLDMLGGYHDENGDYIPTLCTETIQVGYGASLNVSGGILNVVADPSDGYDIEPWSMGIISYGGDVNFTGGDNVITLGGPGIALNMEEGTLNYSDGILNVFNNEDIPNEAIHVTENAKANFTGGLIELTNRYVTFRGETLWDGTELHGNYIALHPDQNFTMNSGYIQLNELSGFYPGQGTMLNGGTIELNNSAMEVRGGTYINDVDINIDITDGFQAEGDEIALNINSYLAVCEGANININIHDIPEDVCVIGIHNNGTYHQMGGEVNVDNTSGYYPAMVSVGATLLNSGTLNVYGGNIGFVQGHDFERPEEERSILQVLDANLNATGKFFGILVEGMAEFNGGAVYAYAENDANMQRPIAVHVNKFTGNEDRSGENVSSLTIRGGNHEFTAYDYGDLGRSYGMIADSAPITIEGGNVTLDADIAFYSRNETEEERNVTLGSGMNFVSRDTGAVLSYSVEEEPEEGTYVHVLTEADGTYAGNVIVSEVVSLKDFLNNYEPDEDGRYRIRSTVYLDSELNLDGRCVEFMDGGSLTIKDGAVLTIPFGSELFTRDGGFITVEAGGRIDNYGNLINDGGVIHVSDDGDYAGYVHHEKWHEEGWLEQSAYMNTQFRFYDGELVIFETTGIPEQYHGLDGAISGHAELVEVLAVADDYCRVNIWTDSDLNLDMTIPANVSLNVDPWDAPATLTVTDELVNNGSLGLGNAVLIVEEDASMFNNGYIQTDIHDNAVIRIEGTLNAAPESNINLNKAEMIVDGTFNNRSSIMINDGSNMTVNGILNTYGGAVHVGYWKQTEEEAEQNGSGYSTLAGILNINGNFNNYGYLNIGAETEYSGGYVNVYGNLNNRADTDSWGFVEHHGQMNVYGEVANYAGIDVCSEGTLTVESTGTLTNYDGITVYGALNIYGELLNNWSIQTATGDPEVIPQINAYEGAAIVNNLSIWNRTPNGVIDLSGADYTAGSTVHEDGSVEEAELCQQWYNDGSKNTVTGVDAENVSLIYEGDNAQVALDMVAYYNEAGCRNYVIRVNGDMTLPAGDFLTLEYMDAIVVLRESSLTLNRDIVNLGTMRVLGSGTLTVNEGVTLYNEGLVQTMVQLDTNEPSVVVNNGMIENWCTATMNINGEYVHGENATLQNDWNGKDALGNLTGVEISKQTLWTCVDEGDLMDQWIREAIAKVQNEGYNGGFIWVMSEGEITSRLDIPGNIILYVNSSNNYHGNLIINEDVEVYSQGRITIANGAEITLNGRIVNIGTLTVRDGTLNIHEWNTALNDNLQNVGQFVVAEDGVVNNDGLIINAEGTADFNGTYNHGETGKIWASYMVTEDGVWFNPIENIDAKYQTVLHNVSHRATYHGENTIRSAINTCAAGGYAGVELWIMGRDVTLTEKLVVPANMHIQIGVGNGPASITIPNGVSLVNFGVIDIINEGVLYAQGTLENCGTINGNVIIYCGDGLTYKYKDGILNVYGSGSIYDYADAAETPWAGFADKITKINLDVNITGIGDNAFAGCTNVTSIVIPRAVASIGENAIAEGVELKVYHNAPAAEFAEENGYTYTYIHELVDGECIYGDYSLNTILTDDTTTEEEKVEELKKTDTDDLKETMQKDAVVMNNIIGLESLIMEKMDLAPDVVVDDTASDVVTEVFGTVSKDAIVGAVLNAKEDAEEVNLVIGDADSESFVDEENYDTDSAVTFSMTLTGVNDPFNLDIPVQLSLPVPAGMDVSIMKLLHSHGVTVEEIEFTLSEDQTTVTFFLTGFSDFAFVEELERDEPAEPAGVITDNGRTLSLAGVIFINQYVKVEGFEGVDIEKNGGLLIWNSAVSEEDALFGTQDDLVEGLIKGNGEYAQQTPGIVAKAYADNLYFRIYIKDNDGNYVYGPLKTYSVRQYCEAQLAKATAKETLKNACAGLLHFGAAAQTYFKYNLDNLANQNILDTYPQPAWDASLLTALETPNTQLTGTGTVTDNGKTLSLTGALLVNFYFGLDASVGTPETAELLFWDEVDGELTLDNVTYRKDLIASGGEYAAQSDMFAAREFGKTIFACAHFVDAEGNDHYSDVVAYSPEQYAAGRLEKSKDANMIALMKAMVTYGEAARLYFAK